MRGPVLGIDLSGPGAGVALLRVGKEMRLALLAPGVARGRALLPSIRNLLREERIAPADLAGIACGVGPGSFTGIRIGIATAATLAYAADLPVVAVCSLDGIAAGAPAEAREILVALDARREMLFCARYRRAEEGRPRPWTPPLRLSPTEAAAGLPPETWVLGDGRKRYPELLGTFPGFCEAAVRPEAIAEIGAARLAAGEGGRPEELRPLYLRLSDPEIRRARRDHPI